MSETTRDLIVYGAGGFGREIAAMAEDGCHAGHGTPKWRVIGFADDTPALRGETVHGLPCLGSLAEASAVRGNAETWCCVAFGDNAARREAAARIEAAGWKAATVIHPSAFVSWQIKLGEGCIVNPMTTISPNVSIGRHALIGTRASIGHDAALGDFSWVAAGASVLGHARIGNGAMIGTNAVVLPHITVGDWATVGACVPAMVPVKPGHTICLPLARTIFKLDRLPDDES
ncbi:MAG: NeuD/PglB/VioB family sugar acetyltransferase [Alphaproteobacteria bacterium]